MNTLLVTLCEKVDKIERRQELIMKAIGKLPKKRGKGTHICQDIGCVRSGKNFAAVTMHETRQKQLMTGKGEMAEQYKTFVTKFLLHPKNRSFYRQCKQHSYVYSAKLGWEEVRASYLLSRLQRITTNAFTKYVKMLRPTAPRKLLTFKIKKSLLLERLALHKQILRDSKCSTSRHGGNLVSNTPSSPPSL